MQIPSWLRTILQIKHSVRNLLGYNNIVIIVIVMYVLDSHM